MKEPEYKYYLQPMTKIKKLFFFYYYSYLQTVLLIKRREYGLVSKMKKRELRGLKMIKIVI